MVALMLRETDLGSYVSEPVELDQERKRNIENLISELEKKPMNVEELPLQLLRIQKQKYPIINPSFLSMSNTIEYEGTKIRVPRFSVYTRTEDGFDDFTIQINSGEWNNRLDIVHGEEEHYFPEVLEKLLLKSIKKGEGRRLDEKALNHLKLDPKEQNYHKNLNDLYNLEISSEFNGIIPQKTKAKLKEAEKIFEDGRIYLIAETKPGEWNVTKINRDPLLMGVALNNKCFLIDHFNTTPMEEYIRKEFTE